MKTIPSHLAKISFFLLIAALGLAACAPSYVAAGVPATAVPTNPPAPTSVPPTAVPTEAPTAAPTAAVPQSVALQITQNSTLGKFLADGNGRTLYLFTKDTKDTSNCYDKCAQAWPPLLTVITPTVSDGVDASLIGLTQRKDGTNQVTYNGWPLYYFAADKNAGDTNGQAVGKVWWVVSGEGNMIKPAALQLATNDKLGKFLADGDGRTLYIFTKDSKDTTVCYAKCEQAWPPLLTVGQPTLGTGVDASLLGTIQRKDGTTQVTYMGMPLYYFAADQKAGDTNGQGVGTVWYVIGADGTIIK